MVQAEQTWLDKLNSKQLEAVTHGDGPLLIVAGAGSGKTRTLAYRVAYLIEKGVAPDRILLLTFTRRAAGEMVRRAESLVKNVPATIANVSGGTFHSFANRILRIYASAAGLSPDFTIIDRTDAEDLVDVIRNEMSFSQKESRFPRKSTCMAIYSRRVNSDQELNTILKKEYPWCEMWQDELKQLFSEYISRKQSQQVLDYDDLLLYLYYILQDRRVAESIGSRYEHILVDEYQDTNKIQAGILKGLRQDNKNIVVVGDDAQSIYSFRSATMQNILEFPHHFPSTKIIILDQNYRSVQPILTTTNTLISQARKRYSKKLWSERSAEHKPQLITCSDEGQQDDEVIRLVLQHYEEGIPLKRQAVLCRAASHSHTLEIALSRRNIPYHKYGGLRFLEAAHIKDLISFLRILENPRDEIAWFRVLQLLNGIGPATAASIFDFIRKNRFDPCSLREYNPPPAARSDLQGLARLLYNLAGKDNSKPGPQIDRIQEFYKPILWHEYEDPEPRARDIEYLSALASTYSSRKQFLADLILDPPGPTADLAAHPIKDEDWLVLSTIHSAKGLEWDVVYLIHASDGFLPSDMATGNVDEIEEELRLTYVSMTRAKDYLYVLWPQRYYSRPVNLRSDSHAYVQRSRFFTDEVVRTMDEVIRNYVQADEDNSIPDIMVEDISSRIQSLWK